MAQLLPEQLLSPEYDICIELLLVIFTIYRPFSLQSQDFSPLLGLEGQGHWLVLLRTLFELPSVVIPKVAIEVNNHLFPFQGALRVEDSRPRCASGLLTSRHRVPTRTILSSSSSPLIATKPHSTSIIMK